MQRILREGFAFTPGIKNSMGKVPVDLTKSEYLRWEQIGGDEVHGGSNGVGDGVTDDDRKM